ncbi:MAG: 2-C-methyl-D-erythritol 4-phosphate cytidylyltransferase [Bacillota bacterium]|jgi:2-C-methyl-D-erythritol 4-phosphate cytidylyltransferase/2-C-methyl-D-erythritol 2,4-cyclodiphosphate synthase
MPCVTAIILAAGKGSRMGLDHNKMFACLADKPVLQWSLAAFSAVEDVAEIIVVASSSELDLCREITRDYSKVNKIVVGGNSRQESVFNALSVLDNKCEFVAVHDGARPFIKPKQIKKIISDAYLYGSAVPAVPVKDTIKEANGCKVINTLVRDKLFAVQTPQVFNKDALLASHQKAQAEKYLVSDDASLLEYYGFDVYLTDGDYGNFKLTTKEDLIIADFVARGNMRKNSINIGTGFDVHQLVSGRKLIIGGVDIPHHKGLLGHSDADVLCHAIADALLGAAALGDIGQHFPDHDPRYKDISSLCLLSSVTDKIAKKNYTINNIDSIIIAQKPKLAPYINEMRKNIAEALFLSIEQVSIKATTTENLGFCGREEGIAAQATVLIEQGESWKSIVL